MKIIHTGDWHIGQLFYGHDRAIEHAGFFDWLLEQIQHLSVDVLLVAGDVFDSPNPSASSQRMFYDLLCKAKMKNPELQIVIIAGNHDSASRLEAPMSLLEELNVSVRGVIKRNTNGDIDIDNLIIPLSKDNKIKAWCMAIPYLRQGDYPTVEETDGDMYSRGINNMYNLTLNRVRELKEPTQAIIAMGHLHVSGGEVSDTERTIIGGLEYITGDVFNSEIAYTALGHLHKNQRVLKRENIRYSGSPIPMSFAERNYNHGVTLIELFEDRAIDIKHLKFESTIKLLSIQAKPIPEIIQELKNLPNGDIDSFTPFLEVNVLLDRPLPSLRHDIEEAVKGKAVRLMNVITKRNDNQLQPNLTLSHEDLKKINPQDIAKEIYQNKYNSAMPQDLELLLNDVIDHVKQV